MTCFSYFPIVSEIPFFVFWLTSDCMVFIQQRIFTECASWILFPNIDYPVLYIPDRV